MKRRNGSGFILYVVLLFVLFYAVSWFSNNFLNSGLNYSQVVKLFEEKKVRSFVLQDDTIRIELWDAENGVTQLTGRFSGEAFREDMGQICLDQLNEGTLESYTILPDSEPSILVKTLPYFLAGTAVLVIWIFLSSKANNGNGGLAGFSKARAGVGGDSNVTFADVAGAEEEKKELQEVVEFLQNPDKFHNMGAKIPKGILLVGPPGTGKTLLAKAVAGEAKATFLSISGSDFVELYVGVGAGRVRDLFEQAKKVSPAIIFIDEIDAVGRRRGAGMGGGHDEREQTLNQLLVEMDGFQKNEDVIVLAATNREDILDPALLRPGRFDRQVYVGAPDAKGREAILKIHTRNKRLDGRVDLKRVAMSTSGFTGADLKNLMNEAAIQAVREDHPVITGSDIQEAMMKILAGPEKRSHAQLARDRRITAIHEAGHAVAMYHLPTNDPVHQISIIPRGNALGVTISLPEHDSSHMTRNEMYENIVSLLGGRVAEALYCKDISTGASNDIQRATSLARDMVAKYGMSDKIGTLSYDGGSEIFVGRDYEKTKTYSEQTAGELDHETKALVDKAYDQCTKILQENGDKLMEVAEFLLAHENMSGAQFRDCMEGREVNLEDDLDLFAPIGEDAEE